MFCALVTIVVLFLVLIGGVTISAIDIESYNFGLYYALLAIVGIMIACAICIVKPPSIKNPKWYDRCCRRMANHFASERRKRADSTNGADRGTLVMLGPALALMHHVLHGMASQQDSDEQLSGGFIDMSATDTSDTTSNENNLNTYCTNKFRVPETIAEEPTNIPSFASNA